MGQFELGPGQNRHEVIVTEARYTATGGEATIITASQSSLGIIVKNEVNW